MSREPRPLPQDSIYRAILKVLVASVVAGALLTLAGELVYHDPGIARAGAYIALVCGAIYFVFRWLGRREMRRREQERERPREPWDDFDERNE